MGKTGWLESTATERCRWRIVIGGTVQGVGFRPFIYQLARRDGLGGWVCNTGDGVLIEVEGEAAALTRFLEGIRREAPPLARIAGMTQESLPLCGETGFEIRHSEQGQSVNASIPPDVCLCPACLADIRDPDNRRYRYPFTNCTNCGPRFTIIRAVPYDRPLTTMAGFAMCPDCRAEYENPRDRRFHAQPNACPVCGPHLTLDDQALPDDEAISATVALLRAGKIIAIKGLGGYHLACDAANEAAVQTLRARKGRAGKPFAVMCPDEATARRLCAIDAPALALLHSPAHPIVLCPVEAGYGLAPSVAPGLNTLGLFLPYTPLHALLLDEFGGPLVMTSGNLSDEPIAYRDEEARARLGHIADHFLGHNRPIHMACDDSVVRVRDGRPMFIRRARGYVPVPIELAEELPQVLACGGDLKNTFCLTRGVTALLSQHLGDLENAVTLHHYELAVRHFCDFYQVQPQVVAHDLHPDYHATRYAHSLAGVPHCGVQHHHAHIAACMAEHRLIGPVIGVAFDGTGYGINGGIWGGEFLLTEYHTFRRAAHLAEFALPGGEAAIRKPGRIALGLLLREGMSPEEAARRVPGMTALEANIVAAQLERGLNAPATSSMGRLFDAVSALLGVCTEVRYEGQAAIELEVMSNAPDDGVYPFHLAQDALGVWQLEPAPLVMALLDDLQRDVDRPVIAARFHATIAGMTVAVCARLRDATGLTQVALSGGVFQNVRLCALVEAKLGALGFAVYQHRQVPCNDGGLSLGQAVVATRRFAISCV